MIIFSVALLAIATVESTNAQDAHESRAAAVKVSDESGNAYQDRAGAEFRKVLARREFADLHSDPYSFWRRFSEWIGGLFERFFKALGDLRESFPWLYWTVITWMVLALVAILAHLIYTLVTLIRGTKRADQAKHARDKISGELLGIQDLDFDKVYAEARRLLAAGEWTTATRYFYVAAILWLDREGAIVFKRSKTNSDYVVELARRGQGHSLFRRLTELFEPIVYGGRQPTNANMNDISTTVESLLHEPAVARPR